MRMKAAPIFDQIHLPRYPSTDVACQWLFNSTSEEWNLDRLIEDGCMPLVWLRPRVDEPEAHRKFLFEGRREGYWAPMPFAGDIAALAGSTAFAVMTMTRTPSGILATIHPRMRFPLSEIRFKRDQIKELISVGGADTCRHGLAKLTEKQKMQIRDLHSQGTSISEIARRFGVTRKPIDRVLGRNPVRKK